MTTSNQLIYRKPRYSWNSILDATTWGILLYMLYMDIPSLKRLIGYVNLGITPLLIVVYALSILLAGIAVTLVRHRIVYPVTFLSFLINLAIQLFVVMIASNPIHWQMFVFVILGQWLIVETLKAIPLQKGVTSANLVRFVFSLR